MTNPRRQHSAVEDAAEALVKLSASRPELATILAKLVKVVAVEAARTPRFANALISALNAASSAPAEQKRSGRRDPGAINPFAVYGNGGEDELRRALGELHLDQLRDIIAEHGMDHDRLAMKWKDPDRVIDRIVEKVSARATKGAAFRQA